MPKIPHIKKNFHIKQILNKKQIIYSPVAVIYYDQNSKNFDEIAIIVSKKIDKRAVIRNKIKRQLIAILNLINININKYSIVFIAKSDWLKYDFSKNTQYIKKMLKRLKGDESNG